MIKRITILILFLSCLILPAFAWKRGDRILGRWHDGMWYPAKIVEVKEEKYALAFDDGDVAILLTDDIRLIDWKEGTSVQCNYQNGGIYYWGKISSIKGEIIHVEYNDGDHEDATISRCRSL